ncbi:MAG: LCP family protein, partial [Chloroflexota bacterium]
MDENLSGEKTQPTRVVPPPEILIGDRALKAQKRKQRWRFLGIVLLVLVLGYFLAPFRTNILVLGTDDSPERGQLGRTDTIILTTIIPLKPYVGALGIPRDLWVEIPGVGEQRINTAYFFAEAEQSGSGAGAAVETVRQNFGVTVDYHIVLHMFGMVDVIDALGGIDIVLDAPQGGFPAGTHHLDGIQALALVRERYSADDFSRMQQGQIVVLASLKKALNPQHWSRLPGVLIAVLQTIETDIPAWQTPRLGFALVRASLSGIDNRIIDREMIT